jgi:hypothetical protein
MAQMQTAIIELKKVLLNLKTPQIQLNLHISKKVLIQ